METFLGVIESVSPGEVAVTQGTSQVSILDDDGTYVYIPLSLFSHYTIPLDVTLSVYYTTSRYTLSILYH